MRHHTFGDSPTCSRKTCEKRRSLQPVLRATSLTVASEGKVGKALQGIVHRAMMHRPRGIDRRAEKLCARKRSRQSKRAVGGSALKQAIAQPSRRCIPDVLEI